MQKYLLPLLIVFVIVLGVTIIFVARELIRRRAIIMATSTTSKAL